jgi:uncharacterized protein (DUF4415 family)
MLRKLAELTDDQIDFSDAPESATLPENGVVGRFYKPVKQLISLRVDADVLHWFRSRGARYQTHMNAVLRREMDNSRKAS